MADLIQNIQNKILNYLHAALIIYRYIYIYIYIYIHIHAAVQSLGHHIVENYNLADKLILHNP